jgi:hypothetical protein
LKNFSLDEHGYPTEEMLQEIVAWDYKDCKGLLDAIKPYWQYSDCGYWRTEEVEEYGKKKLHYHISTGGWSGNEDILESLKANTMFWILAWVQSRRGGHYIFEVDYD